jgi:hypothetical protein
MNPNLVRFIACALGSCIGILISYTIMEYRKPKKKFYCNDCGIETSTYVGKCYECKKKWYDLHDRKK